MKKLATLAILVALASSASAASIAWGFGGKVYLNDGTSTVLATDSAAPAVDSNAYLALVYLGQNVSSYKLDDITSDKVVDSMTYGITTTGKSSAVGKWSPNTKTYKDESMQSGASFAVLFYNGSSFDYVYALSGSNMGAAFDSNILTVVNDNMPIANATIYATGSATGNGVASVAVPEPSTAVLALAGLALLLKRRKA